MTFRFENGDALLVDYQDYHYEITTTQMLNPPHPGEVLREWLGDMEVTEATKHLGATRVTLPRVFNGASGISADMALRLEAALGTSAAMWMGMQSSFELWKASQTKRPPIQKFLERTC